MKRASFRRRNDDRHWLGGGSPVHSIFSYNDDVHELSPFLLPFNSGRFGLVAH